MVNDNFFSVLFAVPLSRANISPILFQLILRGNPGKNDLTLENGITRYLQSTVMVILLFFLWHIPVK